MSDKITQPSHYQFRKPCNEVRDVIRDRTERLINTNLVKKRTAEIADLIYDYSNSIKYLLRCFDKNGTEDLKKARYCIDTLLNLLEDDKDSTNKPIQHKSDLSVSLVELEDTEEQKGLNRKEKEEQVQIILEAFERIGIRSGY